ncbi:hypothetical protein, partial [Paenibacillus plantarum]|uniref:hypothetical protein n=1 Tax=Paenibacillus plantarum TaxID=2654975 RepID=UPI001C0F8ED1
FPPYTSHLPVKYTSNPKESRQFFHLNGKSTVISPQTTHFLKNARKYLQEIHLIGLFSENPNN